MGGAARRHRGRRRAAARPTSSRTSTTSGSRCGRTRRRTPGSCGTGRSWSAFVWLTVRPGEREAHKIGHVGRRAAEPPATGHRHPAVRVGDAARPPRSLPRSMPALPTKLEADAAEHQVDLRALAERHGPRAGAPLPRDRPADARAGAGSSPRRPVSSWCRGARSSTRQARLAHVESFEDHWGSEPRTREEWAQWYTGHRGVPSRPLGPRGRSGERRGGCARAVRGLPAGLGHGAGRGVDQHGRHPARVARQGRGVAG